MSNELIILEEINLVPFFIEGDRIDAFIAQIKEQTNSLVPDTSTEEGRKAIKNAVSKVDKSRIFIEKNRAILAKEYKEKPKKIDANGKRFRDAMTELAEITKAPLVEYEAAVIEVALEAKRVRDAEELAIKVDSDHEFGLLLDAQFDVDIAAKVAAVKAEHAANQAQIKADQEARDKRIAEEAAANAKASAEAAEHRAIAAEELARQQAKQAEENRRAMEQKAIVDADNAAEQARLREIARVLAENQAEAGALAKREANTKHRAAIHKSTKKDLMEILGIDEKLAVSIVMASSKSLISNLTINY